MGYMSEMYKYSKNLLHSETTERYSNFLSTFSPSAIVNIPTIWYVTNFKNGLKSGYKQPFGKRM